MRLFFAVQLPDGARAALSALPRGPGVSWTRAEQLHFTLAFLGEQPDASLALRAGEAVRGLRRFELAVGGAGAFPSPRKPRVLWLGALAGGPQLCFVAERLGAALREHGFTLDARPFQPHLTLGRVRPGGERGAAGALAALPAGELARFRVDEVQLMQSILGPGGARHLHLHSFPL